MPVTRINNNQITDSSSGNIYLGVNAAAKVQDYSVTGGKLQNNMTYGSDFTITGNLTVQGNTTTIDTVNLVVEDPLILLAKEQTGSPTLDIGFIGKRGTSDNIAFVWDESADEFVTVFTTSETTNTVITISAYASLKTLDMAVTGNLSVTGNTSFTGNITSLNVTGNITGGNLLTPGVLSATGNVTGGNVTTAGVVTATGNVQGGNVLTGGLISATSTITSAANVVGGNITTAGVVTATGNVQGGNLVTGGLATVTGNITGGNILTGGLISATSTITSAANVIGGNVTTAGVVTATGNVTGGNVNTAGLVTATGNVTGGNINTGGVVSATGNVNSGNVNTGIVSGSGNITGANFLTAGLVSATGNVTGGNLNSGVLASTGGITIKTASNGNITLDLNGTGNLVLNDDYINGVKYPVQDQDAASKLYVDNMVTTAISYHDAVLAATVANLATTTGGTITYNQPNGAGNGVGATITTTGSFNLIDTANVQTANARILVKDEGNAALNGVYVWSNATVITRSDDTDTYIAGSPDGLSINDYFFVQQGNVNKGSAWIVDAPSGTITFGVSNIAFAQFSSSQTYTANSSAGIVLNGTIFSAKVDNDTTAFDGGGNISVKPGANLVTPNIGAATGTSLSVTGNVTGGNLNTGGLVTATGNVTGGNVTTAGMVTATGNIQGGNLLTGGLISATSTITSAANVTGANITTAGVVTATGNVTGGNILTGGLISATSTITSAANITGGNLLTGGVITATGNLTAGNLNTAGLVTATGNVTGGNVNTAGVVTATGNVTGGNVNTAGLVTATGNVTGGNINTGGVVTATGNITGANLILTSGVIDGPAAGRITINGSDIDTDFAVDGDTTPNIFYVDAGTSTASFGNSTQTTGAIVSFQATNSILMPVGNTSQRPTGVLGMLRFNSTGDSLEVYTSTGWEDVGVPAFTVITADSFAGNGSQTVYTLSTTSTTAATIVSINGVVQIPTTAYSVSGNTLTFTEAPAVSDTIDARILTTTTTVTALENISGNAIVETLDTSAAVQITGNLLPAANVTYDIGSNAMRWNDAYFNGTTITLGNVQIKNNTGTTIGFFGPDGTTPATIDSTNIDTTTIANGTSSVAVIASGGNIRANVGGATILQITSAGIINGQGNGVGNIGNATGYFNTIFAKATSAQYADLAEMYEADGLIEPGTVVAFGGAREVTTCSEEGSRRVAGVVSTNPSYIMNAGLAGEHVVAVALTGRVPTRVTGPIHKGDMLVSAGAGRARAEADPQVGQVIGKALADFDGAEGVIEVVVGRL